MSLKATAVEAAKWTAVSGLASAGIQFAQLAILARLLSPSDFGIVAMVMVVLGFAQTYLDMGISNAIIHRQDTSKEQLSSLYWLNILAGWIIFGIIVAVTPLIVILFGEPYLSTILPLAAIMFLIVPPGAQFSLLLQKGFRFRTLALVENTATLSGALIAIGGACMGLGSLALVLGQLFASAIASLILFIVGMRSWRPMLRFRREDIKGYLGFGLYQMGERTLNFLGSRADQLVIGIVLGPAALGYYSLAWSVIIQPVSRINPIITRVAFPLFAQIQNQDDRLKRGYLTLLRILSAINAPLLFGCAATAPIFIPVVYGSQWTSSIQLVQILAAVGFLRSIINPIGTLQLAKGRADMGFFWNLGIVGLQLIGVPVGVYFGGLVGVAVCLLLLFISYYVATYFFMVRALLGPCLGLYVQNTLSPVPSAAVMAMTVSVLPWLVTASPPMVLASQLVVGVILYLLLTRLLQPLLISELATLLGTRSGLSS